MANKGRSDPGLFGGYNHYDEKGKKIGSSKPGLFGSFTDYDNKGHKIGHSSPGLFGGYNHYDEKGKKIGSSKPGLFGSYVHYDSKGKKTGFSDPGLFGSYSRKETQGCYIATCVYDSYDCPEVWTLRRFRDHFLAKTCAGRIFIRLYYRISPAIVKRFGHMRLFRSFWRYILDKMTRFLLSRGYDNSPYNDSSIAVQHTRCSWRH